MRSLDKGKSKERIVYLKFYNSIITKIREIYIEQYQNDETNLSILSEQMKIDENTLAKILRGEIDLSIYNISLLCFHLNIQPEFTISNANL